MSPVDEILAQIPMQQLASQLGVDVHTATQAAASAVPALLGGIQANTDDPGGAASFSQAIGQHSGALIDGGVDLGQVDVNDGQKIVGNIFGGNQDQVVQQLGGLGGQAGNDLIAKLLPILAPIVMSWLAKQFLGGGAAAPAGAPAGNGGLGDLLGGVLGNVLGGGAAPGGAAPGGVDLGSILGGLLGGGRR